MYSAQRFVTFQAPKRRFLLGQISDIEGLGDRIYPGVDPLLILWRFLLWDTQDLLILLYVLSIKVSSLRNYQIMLKKRLYTAQQDLLTKMIIIQNTFKVDLRKEVFQAISSK
ncbi:hypothetical protein Salmi_Mp099 (mitochondrion) [Salvia miltiorrhiza]|uniref:Uncharacterized protein n=1 Tax=Salvia miltiorrhiza TaxID=226208 RepID=V9P5M3_SALMI|nr:hypothetical protein Salmi_Mp099 [Salvia miltiorrhiza]AGU16627.1 hypothetical protein Salmi_Mp099 [Salvia miltiorrhiza]